MKIQKGLIEFNNGIIISYWQQWYELFHWRKYNWNDYDILHIRFENDIYTGAYEFTLIIFLLGVQIRIPHETEKGNKFWKKMKSIDKQLEQSCYGYVNREVYKKFTKKEFSKMIVFKNKINKGKKIFIQ